MSKRQYHLLGKSETLAECIINTESKLDYSRNIKKLESNLRRYNRRLKRVEKQRKAFEGDMIWV